MSPLWGQGIYNNEMADQLYLNLWYPNFRLTSLGPALLGIRQFTIVGRSGLVKAAILSYFVE